MSDQLARHELHICNDILFIYNFIVKILAFYPTNLVFKWNLRNLSKRYSNLSPLQFLIFTVSAKLNTITLDYTPLRLKVTPLVARNPLWTIISVVDRDDWELSSPTAQYFAVIIRNRVENHLMDSRGGGWGAGRCRKWRIAYHSGFVLQKFLGEAKG